MNDEGKIQLEETLNESANITASTASDGDVVDDSSAFDESGTATDAVRGPTAEVLSIDEHDTSTNYQNHLITNQINNNNNNNNNINTKSNDSDETNVDENPSDVTEASAIAADTAEQVTSSSTSTTATTAIAENGVSNDVVDEKPIVALNSTPNDAANAVGFFFTTQINQIHLHTEKLEEDKKNI